ILEGAVTNVANFGAFIDIGVHQDGLVHISALADKFVKDPREVVRVGQTVKVKVQEVDIARKRIALTMRLNETVAPLRRDNDNRSNDRQRTDSTASSAKRPSQAPATGAMAAAFAKLKK
ncbi:MAG: S1 RNA-binding domain-containing protein, partial [Burkholderiaceae bacterium]